MPADPNPDRPIANRVARATPCPTCGKPVVPAHSPFCSQGCRDRDLIQWLSDGYRIPGAPVDDEDAKDLGDAGLDS
jgi:endogenous inhibitor of DNA gyrase (YacG/DUF329 family)